MIVSGAVWPDGGPEISPEAARQLRLRLHNACCLARSFVDAGFNAVVDDIVVGSRLDDLLTDLAGLQFGFVMLVPAFEVVHERWRQIGSPFAEVFGWIDDEIRLRTRRVGLWLDTTAFSPDQTAAAILSRLHEAEVRP
jgi:chloramphenicol 3-O-phosphotransferase